MKTLLHLLINKRALVILYIFLMQSNFSFAQEKQKLDSLDVAMKQLQLEEVVITGTRASEKTPIAYTNITKKEINDRNLGQDIPILMELTPSFVSTSDGGTGVGYTNMRIRGSDNTRINVTMNGIPMNDAESHGVWWVNMPDLASSLEDIQVQRGVGTSTNGAGAFGASINLRTNTLNKNPYAEVNGTYGSFNTQKYNLKGGSGLLAGKFAVDARASKIHTDGFIDRATVDLQSFFASASYYGEGNSVIFNYIDGKERTYQAWNGVPKSYLGVDSLRTYNNYTYENEVDDYHQTHFQLFYNQKINDNWNSEIAGFYVKGSGYYEQYKSGQKLASYGLDLVDGSGNPLAKSDLVRQKWLDNDFYGGVFNLTYDNQNTNLVIGGGVNQYKGDHFGKVLWVKDAQPQTQSTKPEYYRNTATKNDYNLYTKINQQITEKLNVYADMQYRKIEYKFIGLNDKGEDLPSSDTHNFFLPKAGVTYSITDNSSVFISYARGAKEPNRNDYTENPTSQIPTAEYLNDFEAGYKLSSSSLVFETNLYYMQYDDQLIATGKLNDVGNAIRVNVPESYRAGIELSGGWKISEVFRWDANIAFSKNEIKEYTEYIDDWDTWSQHQKTYKNTTMAFSPDIVASSSFTITPLKGLSFSLIEKHVGSQYIDNTEDELRMLDAYAVTNIKAEYKFKLAFFEEIAVTALINNIFNAKYESNAWIYKYKSGDGSSDGSFGDIYSTDRGNGYYDMAGYFPQAGTNFLIGLRLKI